MVKRLAISLYAAEDTFDASALLESVGKRTFVVTEAARCLLLPRPLFLHAVQAYPAFTTLQPENFPAAGLAAIDRGSAGNGHYAIAKIRDAYIHPPVFIRAEASIHDAALAMKADKINSLLVQRGEDTGIVTATDLREAAIIQRQPLDAPVGPIASYDLIGMDLDDFLFNALLRMTRYNINRLVIRDGAVVHGILEQIDLLSYLSNHSHLIALQIERAASRMNCSGPVVNYGQCGPRPACQRRKIRYIMQLVSELNKKVLHKLFELLAPPELRNNACLLVLGSEGREEQVLKTDQDNA